MLELSIVIVILGLVSVLGLETALQFIGQRAYKETQAKLVIIDQALVQFYKVNGRLPLPANRLTSSSNINYGLEAGVRIYNVPPISVIAGTVPFRALNLPMSVSLDSYGNKINYYVSRPLAYAVEFAAGPPAIEIRSGKLEQPCSTQCTVLADPAATPSTGAAYAVFSNGFDKRGAVNKNGTPKAICADAGDVRIDSQNCLALAGGGPLGIGGTIAANVLYDSRYNTGSVAASYYDDAIIWRLKGQL